MKNKILGQNMKHILNLKYFINMASLKRYIINLIFKYKQNRTKVIFKYLSPA